MHFPRRPAILSSRAAKPTPSWSAAVTSGAWPSGPLQFLPVPAIKKSPRIAVFKRFSGGFPVQPGRCPPRCAAADVRPPAAPGHKKRRRPSSTPFPPRITENEFLKSHFPALVTAVSRLSSRGFLHFPRQSRCIPDFSNTLSPYTDAKQRHGMRYTHHRGQAHVSNWVRLKFTAMNLKKLARWKARRHSLFFRLLYFHSTYLFLLLRPAWRFSSLAAFQQAETDSPRGESVSYLGRGPYRVFASSTTFLMAAAASSGSLLKPPSSVSRLVT